MILVNIPYGESLARYKTNMEYAESKGLPYYDFNEESLFNEIGYNAVEDLLEHPNYKGAEKISLFLGDKLSTEYGIESKFDESYNISREVYNHKVENILLTQENDPYRYLDMINNDRYTIFVFAPISYSEYISEDFMNKINNLGFVSNLIGVPEGTHYCAIKDAGDVIEGFTSDNIKFSNSIRNGSVVYNIDINTEMMWDRFHRYSMVIGGEECGNNNPGISFVIYDNDFKYIADKVNINTASENLDVTHY